MAETTSVSLPALEDEAMRLIGHLKSLATINEGLDAAVGQVVNATRGLEQLRAEVEQAGDQLRGTQVRVGHVLEQMHLLDPASLRNMLDDQFALRAEAESRLVGELEEKFDCIEEGQVNAVRAAESLSISLEAARKQSIDGLASLISLIERAEKQLREEAADKQVTVSQQIAERFESHGRSLGVHLTSIQPRTERLGQCRLGNSGAATADRKGCRRGALGLRRPCDVDR